MERNYMLLPKNITLPEEISKIITEKEITELFFYRVKTESLDPLAEFGDVIVVGNLKIIARIELI
jgi:hypothetical protein